MIKEKYIKLTLEVCQKFTETGIKASDI